MVRPRNKPIEITAERQMENLQNRFSRRQLIQMFGAAAATTIAGCGGGDQEGGEEGTPAGGGQQIEAETGTPTETDTPTESATPTETDTPAGTMEIVDEWANDTTTTNLEKLQPNAWNVEGGGIPFPGFGLSFTNPSLPVNPGKQEALDMFFMQAAKRFELDTENNELVIELRDNLQWGDGTKFDVETVQMHNDILQGQLRLGNVLENVLPVSMEATDDYTLDLQLAPGNAILRMMNLVWSSSFTEIYQTHPKLHGKYVENIREATTQNEVQSALQELFKATFPADAMPKLALGAFKAADWNPNRILFESRENFPWGLDYHPEMDRILKGVRVFSVTEEANILNAVIGGKKDWMGFVPAQAMKRFDKSNWRVINTVQNASTTMFFSPKSKFGKKNEKARMMRKAVAYLTDSREFAKVGDHVPSYEQSAGYCRKPTFQNWIGEDTFKEWTNYGKRDTGYLFKEKGYAKFREAGFNRNKDGIWVDQETGEAATAEFVAATVEGLTRPMLDNLIEQLNRHGIDTTANIFKGATDEFNVTVSNEFDFDLTALASNTEVFPHPWNGYREDMGIGSREGMGITIGWWDWRNNYRRVKVPMPVGDQDGEMTTYDWDKRVMEMANFESQDRMKERSRELSWVMNQWVPGVSLIAVTVRGVINSPGKFKITDDWKPIKYFDQQGQPHFNLAAGFWQPA